jgi:DNA polymerase-1
LSRKESADLIEAYYQSYPRLKSYIEQIEFARENGYVQTILGRRRRYLKDINSQNAMVRGRCGAKCNALYKEVRLTLLKYHDQHP